MVGWLHREEKGRFRPRVKPVGLEGYPLLEAALPPGERMRRLKQGARALKRRGVVRVLTEPGLADREELRGLDLLPVDPLPLCLEKAGDMATFLLRDIPPRQRRLALRGEQVTGRVCALALEMCPRVGTLLLDFARGEEELWGLLRSRWGAAPPGRTGTPPHLTVDLAPRERGRGPTLKLWGEPDLGGLALSLPGREVRGMEPLEFFTLLWESGRVESGEIQVSYALDRPIEKTYNNP